MTSSSPKSAGDFTAYVKSSDGATLAKDRNAATKEERQVLALEMIADQLSLIARHLGSMLPSHERPDIDIPRSENSDGLGRDDADQPIDGIKRNSTETFSVGHYNYTNLEHAIEEAKRARKRAAGSVSE